MIEKIDAQVRIAESYPLCRHPRCCRTSLRFRRRDLEFHRVRHHAVSPWRLVNRKKGQNSISSYEGVEASKGGDVAPGKEALGTKTGALTA